MEIKDNNLDRIYRRNYGFWNEQEQEKINNSKIAIAGVGGDGFQLGIKLAMMGVKNFSVADPEEFERENSNRVFGAKISTYGKNKAEVFKDMVLDIHPDAKIEVFNDGVTEDNVEEFLKDSDLLLDESELRYLKIGTMLARTARKMVIPDLMVMNIGFSSIATSFNPKPSWNQSTFESVMGIPKGMPIDEVNSVEVDFSKCLPYVPSYGDIRSLKAVQEGASLPSITQGVDVASALGSTEAFFHLTSGLNNNRRKPTWAPKFRYMDAYNGESGIIRGSRVSHYMGLVAIAGRSLLGMNPRASYSQEDRDRREK
ncbi:MAG TPA: ThiF family adenylyltransferase [Candidatus Saccharibacteria bacterium]|nr:ThiF family adenylyltransferase [Candidatus Saccharibacteria bacterium]